MLRAPVASQLSKSCLSVQLVCVLQVGVCTYMYAYVSVGIKDGCNGV